MAICCTELVSCKKTRSNKMLPEKAADQINQQINKDQPPEHQTQINNRRLEAATYGGVLPVRLSYKINT